MSNAQQLKFPLQVPQSGERVEIPFLGRHLGPGADDEIEMLRALGCNSIEQLIGKVIPAEIRLKQPLSLTAFSAPKSEDEALADLRSIAAQNRVARSFIGMGYSRCITPPIIRRNILENPSWYTAYTPYQPEISQGRLEALLNFQTMICDLTGMEIANASLLDEATAAAEAMGLAYAHHSSAEKRRFIAADSVHPQTLAVLATRAAGLGIALETAAIDEIDIDSSICGVLVQYPDSYGTIHDYRDLAAKVHSAGALLVVAADPLALTVLTPPGRFGADVVIGSSQRFGVPPGFGGPHAAFFAVRDQYKRLMPGRLVGVSKDRSGKAALRLSLQTREQHIRREKATSNICTAQVLLAVMAGMYAVYHGPDGLRRIAVRINQQARSLAAELKRRGFAVSSEPFFDTLRVSSIREGARVVASRAEKLGVLLRVIDATSIGVSIDECTTRKDLRDILEAFCGQAGGRLGYAPEDAFVIPEEHRRAEPLLVHPVFNQFRSETEFQRYIKKLESRDITLTDAMIPLGSCTMKLNAASEMVPVTWPEFAELHPAAPAAHALGYQRVIGDLEQALAEMTAFAGVSLQPNSGAQGEYAGLMIVRAYHAARGEAHRDIVLIPKSAHGTNPASAAIAGYKVVVVECDAQGNVNVEDLEQRAAEAGRNLAAVMITYPSTHGVFEREVQRICEIVHRQGGQVYMDGANLNAQVGLTAPGRIGADLCHINLHKTFCIPHGGGGPGMGPIAVAKHLVPFLPGHPFTDGKQESQKGDGKKRCGPVSAAPYGSAGILVIPWMYLAMMGPRGVTRASEVAILNANYIAKKLEPHYQVLYKGEQGFVAHECIIDLRPLKKSSGVEAEDVAKRLMDYGFHAPTVSFPVAGTLMIEPTESEPRAELDRFIEAMIAIRAEIAAIEQGKGDAADNPLKNAPHTAEMVTSSEWNHKYTREEAAYPVPALRDRKIWPAVGRIDSVYGDRNLVCTCPPIEEYR